MTAFEVLKRADLFGDFTETGLRIFAGIAIEKSSRRAARCSSRTWSASRSSS